MKEELVFGQGLPKGCEMVPITRVCHLMTGGTPSKSVSKYWKNGTINWLVSGDVNNQFIREVNGKITKEGMENSNAKMIPSDSVIMALNGQGKTRGTVAVLKVESTCNQSLVAFIPKNRKELDYLFLYYFLKSQYQKLRNLTGDNERSGLSMRILKELYVPLPKFTEQVRISGTIDKKMALIDEIKKEILRELDAVSLLPHSLLNHVFEEHTKSEVENGKQ